MLKQGEKNLQIEDTNYINIATRKHNLTLTSRSSDDDSNSALLSALGKINCRFLFFLMRLGRRLLSGILGMTLNDIW